MPTVREALSTGGKVAVVVIVIVIGIAATLAVTLSKISPSSSTSSTPGSTTTQTSVSTSGGTIVVEEGGSIDSLDPAVAFAAQGGEAVQQVYQGLLAFKPNSSEIVPLIAENYNVSSDGLTYDFLLRQNITFANGDPVNAYVLWYSIYRSALMAQSPSFLVTVALNTTGVTDTMLNQFNSANNVPPSSLLQVMQNPKLAITVTGQYSLAFHLPKPFAAFLATLTQPQSFAVDPKVVSQHGGVHAGNTSAWMTLNAVGTGPFGVSSYQTNFQLTLERNPTYWGGANGAQATPKVERVIIKYVADALTRLVDLKRGSAQIIYLDFSLVDQVTGSAGVYLPSLGPMPTLSFLPMDTQKFPFNNSLIRQAVVHAINETALLKLFHGLGNSYVGPVPKGVLGYAQDLQPYGYNLSLSKQLLAKAGYPNGHGIPTITIIGTTDLPPGPEVALVVQADLSQIGINSKIKSLTYTQMSTLLTDPKSPNYPDMLYEFWNWFPDPWAFANWFVGPLAPGPGNFAWYNVSTVWNLLSKADSTINQTQRAAIYNQVAHIVYDDVPYFWVAQVQNGFPTGVPIVNINVRGYVVDLGFWESDFSLLSYGS
jgi:peptide/nickel transport system substrate-binding protein